MISAQILNVLLRDADHTLSKEEVLRLQYCMYQLVLCVSASSVCVTNAVCINQCCVYQPVLCVSASAVCVTDAVLVSLNVLSLAGAAHGHVGADLLAVCQESVYSLTRSSAEIVHHYTLISPQPITRPSDECWIVGEGGRK